MKFEKLSKENIDKYIDYLRYAIRIEPDMMTTDKVDEDDIKSMIDDKLYQNSVSILAFDDDKVAGRIEYHFYACIQDGYKMCYVNWIYVLPQYRGQKIAKSLFEELEKECKKNGICEYYLIRASNKQADRFYSTFEKARLSTEPILRKIIE